MDANFWHERWQANQIGFHQPKPNAMLVAHIGALDLAPGARIFLPLCGKTLDIGWLLGQGFRIAGAELSRLAIEQLFEGLGVTPEITEAGALTRFSADGIDIFVGDIFALDAATLGPVDAVYDRAALVALPDGMRARYAGHLPVLTSHVPQLLVTFDYDQSVMDGPPFSVPRATVDGLYASTFRITALANAPVEGGLKGIAPATEIALHLSPGR
ncbi:MAG: thiopurine S-methyltransferase [Pseudomonadota bacterium]